MAGRKKGTPKTGGRKGGVTNKVTTETKDAFKKLVESNHENMTIWLEKIAMTDPYKAMQLMIQLSEYFIPKLARTELSGEVDTKQKQVFIIGGKEIEL